MRHSVDLRLSSRSEAFADRSKAELVAAEANGDTLTNCHLQVSCVTGFKCLQHGCGRRPVSECVQRKTH